MSLTLLFCILYFYILPILKVSTTVTSTPAGLGLGLTSAGSDTSDRAVSTF